MATDDSVLGMFSQADVRDRFCIMLQERLDALSDELSGMSSTVRALEARMARLDAPDARIDAAGHGAFFGRHARFSVVIENSAVRATENVMPFVRAIAAAVFTACGESMSYNVTGQRVVSQPGVKVHLLAHAPAQSRFNVTARLDRCVCTPALITDIASKLPDGFRVAAFEDQPPTAHQFNSWIFGAET
jgi:hypothetical protein